MKEPQQAVAVLVFGYPGGRFVALADDVESFEMQGASLEPAGVMESVDLDRCLGVEAVVSDSPARRLLIDSSSGTVILTTTAMLHFDTFDASRFFLLPWILRQTNHRKWVRGVVEFDEVKTLGIWIDLRRLGFAKTPPA